MAKTNEKIKICILTSEHQATDQRIFHKQAVSLRQAGYEVYVYGKHPRDEQIKKIQIYSVRRPKKRLLRKVTASFQYFFKVILKNYDIFHFHDPDLIPCGLLLTLIGKKVVMDVHEDFKETIIQKRHYLPAFTRTFIATIIDRIEKAAASFFSGTVAVSEEIADKFYPSNVVVVKNFPNIQKEYRHTRNNDKPLQIIYTGRIGIIRGCWELLYGFEQLRQRYTNAELKLIGPIADRQLEQKLRAKAAEIKAVEICGYLPYGQIQSIQSKADVGVLFTNFKTESNAPVYPVKLFEYMAAGLPVILTKKKYFESMMKMAEFGIILQENTSENISDALYQLAVNPQLRFQLGQNGKMLTEKHYSWQHEFAHLRLFYKRLLNSS